MNCVQCGGYIAQFDEAMKNSEGEWIHEDFGVCVAKLQVALKREQARLSVVAEKALKMLEKNGQLWRREAEYYTDAPDLQATRNQWGHMNESTVKQIREVIA